MVLQFLSDNWDSVLVVVAFIAACVLLVRRGFTPYVKKMLFYLVTEAEQEFGGGTGELKYAAVTTWLYERLPSIVKFFFTPKQISGYIEAAVKELKEYLNANEKAQALIMDGGGTEPAVTFDAAAAINNEDMD